MLITGGFTKCFDLKLPWQVQVHQGLLDTSLSLLAPEKDFAMTLPSEVLLQIFQFLGNQDLKAVLLVCKLWNSVGEDPSLWRSFPVTIQLKKDLKGSKIFKNPRIRFEDIENLTLKGNFRCAELKDIHLHQILHLRLNHLSLRNITLYQTSPKLLAKVISTVETVTLCNIHDESRSMSIESHAEELSRCFLASTKIKTIKLYHFHLFNSTLEPALVGRSLNTVEELEISGQNLREHKYLRCLFENIYSQTNLKSLKICDQDLSHIKPNVLSRAVHRIRIVKLCNAQLSKVQIEKILERTAKHTALAVLDIRDNSEGAFKI